MRKWPLCFSLFLAVVTAGGSVAGDKATTGSITGKIVLDTGEPMSGGKMVFFKEGAGPPPSPGRYLRPPDEMIDIDPDGTFTATLPEGRYYVTAIGKTKDDVIGPPVEGEYLFPTPMDLQRGRTIFSVKRGEQTDIGIGEAVPFTKGSVNIEDKITAIEGTITGPDGKPVRGAIVLAFPAPNSVGKPLFLSERTGNDGKYSLRFAEGGTYYVRTRTSLKGGHPEEKEVLGVYGEAKPLAVKIKTGEIVDGIDIRGRVFTNQRKGLPGMNRKIGITVNR